jgi:hypothetical protein
VTVTLRSSVKTNVNIYVVLTPDFKTYMHDMSGFFSTVGAANFLGGGGGTK